MKISPARAAAFDALLRVERDAAFAPEALDGCLRRARPSRSDSALATEIVLGVLRWRGLLDFLLERCAGRPAGSLDLEVLLALRVGAYQLRYLSRVPPSAAVNQSVELVRRARKSSAAGLVNAILRRAARDPAFRGPGEELVPKEGSPAERLALAWSHPAWLVERWLARLGGPGTRALLEADNRPPKLTAAILHPAGAATVTAELRRQGFQPAPAGWLRSALDLRRPELSTPNDGVRRAKERRRGAGGEWFVQDEASQMVPLLLGIQPGQRVLDLCAAPGGKTARLLELCGGTPGCLVACDRHLHRLRQMREFLREVSAGTPHYVVLDGTHPLPFRARFDCILVDAPCSGTGTLARNPEIRWRLRPADLPALAEKQQALLSHALDQLAPGGRLVYSTCSLEPEENEQVVTAALRAHPAVRIVSGEAGLARHLHRAAEARALFDANGCFRTLPSVHGMDGFFAVLLETANPSC